MPYSTLDGEGSRIFEEVYNKALKQYNGDKEKAARTAWSALKGAGYHKDAESGKWVKGKSEFAEFSMAIVKASFDKENQVMHWRSVNSDTDPDLYEESMSPELFVDFVNRIKDNTPVPAPFDGLVCEDEWCGGMPYLSLAHYKSGTGKKNVPGEPESVYVDGKMLKSTGILYNTVLGKRVFDALNRDLYKRKSDGTPEVPPENRIRVSIGFLDLEHKHILDDGTEKVFSREDVGQVCQLCSSGIGRKIYTKGQLVHLALTRVPVNPRTLVEVDKSMGTITTKKDDAESIIGKDLVEELEEKSLADGVLVVKADGTTPGALDFPDGVDECYDPDTGGYDQECIDEKMMGLMPQIRNEMTKNTEVKSDTVSKAVTKSEPWGDESASSYLVVGDPKHPTTWHLPVKENGKINARLMGRAKAELTTGGRSGKGYLGPNKAKALAKLKSLYRAQGMDWGEEKSVTEDSMAKANEVDGKKKVKPEEIDRFEDEKGVDEEEEAYGQGKARTMRKGDEPESKKEDEEETEADEEAEAKKVKKSFMTKASKVADKIVALRNSGVTGKDAEAALQPLLNELGSTIERSLTPATTDMGEVAKALRDVAEVLADTRRELAVLKAEQGQKSDTTKSPFVPAPRSIQVQRSNPAQPVKQLSQIEKLARKSTGLPVEE